MAEGFYSEKLLTDHPLEGLTSLGNCNQFKFEGVCKNVPFPHVLILQGW